MATKFLRIGSIVDAVSYDDVDFDSALETDAPIKAGDPIDPTDVINLRSMKIVGISVANITNPAAEMGTITGSINSLYIAQQVVGAGGEDLFTLYGFDASGPAVNLPYVVADASGGRFIALGGRYSYISHIFTRAAKFYDLEIYDTDKSNSLQLKWNEDDGSDRILNILVDAGSRSLTISGDSVIDQDLSTSGSPSFSAVKVAGTQVVGAQQGAIGSVAAVPDLTGADTIDQAGLESYLGDIISALNDVLSAMKTHGLIDT